MSVAKHITTNAAGAVRLVSLRLTASERSLVESSKSISVFIQRFLEKAVQPPFRFKQISELSFAISAPCDDDMFSDYAITLHERLKEFLFGSERSEEADVLVFAGNDVDVAKFLSETEEEASARSEAFVKRVQDAKAESGSIVVNPAFKPMTGKRPLLFRGILECKHNVLLAYAITPSSSDRYESGDFVHGDISLAQYLQFRGAESIRFSMRVFDKASYLLQTSREEGQKVFFNCPLSYRSVLSIQDKHQFFENMNQHPDWVRDHMFLTVYAAPPSASSSVIQRFCSQFSPYFRFLDWHVTHSDFAPNQFMAGHLHSVSLDLDNVRSHREQELRHFLEKVASLRKLKIRAGVYGVETVEELRQCAQAGVTYASGNAITGALTSFSPVRTVSPGELPILQDAEHFEGTYGSVKRLVNA